MVDTSAGSDRRLLRSTQARRGLAGVEHLHRRVARVRRRDELRGQGGDAREVPEEVQRGALGREDGPQRPGHLHHGLARRPARCRRRRTRSGPASGRRRRNVSVTQARPASTPDWRARKRDVRNGAAGTSAVVMSPSGQQVLGQGPCHRVGHPGHRGPGRPDRRRSRPGSRMREHRARCAAARAGRPRGSRCGSGHPGSRCGQCGDEQRVGQVNRLASSPAATGRRPPTRPPVATPSGRRQRLRAPHDPGPSVMARCSGRGASPRRARAPSPPVGPGGSGRPVRPVQPTVDPRGAEDGPQRPRSARARPPRRDASARRAPNTMPSSSELEASRLAPWTPVQATSPAAHNPGSAVAPHRSVSTPPDR